MHSQKFYEEVLLWQRLHHKYILPFIGIDRESFPSFFCMVSPWMERGTILHYLREHGRADFDNLLLQVAEGLGYLHSMKVIHGDLRGANILMSDNWNVCLADFGLSSISDAVSGSSGAATSTSNRAGSLRWLAPELIYPSEFGCPRFERTPATDVYAFACVCVELLTGLPPFSGVLREDVAVIMKVLAGDRPARPASMSDDLWGVVTAAWAQNSRDRPRIEIIIDRMSVLCFLHSIKVYK
ncbi:kinase-like domain-containing protein [Mycena capillaripes]|nr:kinase-like domain-containing protein [Mycena capillaripes]